MPQWAGSCWYFIRFVDPHNQDAPWSKEAEEYWMPVDIYIGGAEHAVLHLLYSRFWHKVLYDLGHISTKEPFQRLVNQGMILGENGQKMSKSLGNVINPDEVIQEHGSDILRMYYMFMGPLEKAKPWSTTGLEGIERFLKRVWRMILDDSDAVSEAITDDAPEDSHVRVLHETIKKVTEDIENLRFNTAISQMMIFVNEMMNSEKRNRQIIKSFILLLSPFAPHVCEELWEIMGESDTLAYEPWPEYLESKLIKTEYNIPVQINGKVRDNIVIPEECGQDEALQIARESANVHKYIDGKSIIKVIFIEKKIMNIVVR